MEATQIKPTSFIKKHKTTSAIIALVTVLWVVVLCVWLSTIYASHSLGSGMEYLGKKDSGNIFGFDQAPSSDYYYGTDMSLEEVEKYFKGAEKGYSYATNATIISFTYNKESFDIYYYQDKNLTSFNTNRKHVISLIDEDYAPAKKALK